MADNPGGSYRSRHNVSRHTMVMRRARDEDARRLEGRDEDAIVVHDSGVSSARLTARGANTRVIRRPQSERTSSGSQVVVEHGTSGRYSTRLTGRQATSVSVAGGDTIIKYKSGDVVIRRGARRAELRKQIIWTYALGYLILFGSYVFFLLTGTSSVTPGAFIEKSFARRHSATVHDLELASLEAMKGNRTPAEIRMAQTLSFYDENKDVIHVAKGDRLTLLTAAKLGHQILEDQKREPAKREFQEPFLVYKETYLAGVNWPYWMTFYNALGFFLLLGLFLWRPIMHYLGTQGKKTAVALKNARDAQQEAADYRDKYRSLASELEDKGERMRGVITTKTETDREETLLEARRQAEAIAGGVEGALQNEEKNQNGQIGASAALAACERAGDILRERCGQAEHDAAMEELIADIAGMKFDHAVKS